MASYTYWSLVLLKNASGETEVSLDLVTVLLIKNIQMLTSNMNTYIVCFSKCTFVYIYKRKGTYKFCRFT